MYVTASSDPRKQAYATVFASNVPRIHSLPVSAWFESSQNVIANAAGQTVSPNRVPSRMRRNPSNGQKTSRPSQPNAEIDMTFAAGAKRWSKSQCSLKSPANVQSPRR